MPRKASRERREELETAIIEHVLEQGIADLSFRTVADALGVSTYTLVYHFGSKEQLMDAVVAGIEARQQRMVAQWVAESAGASAADLLRRYWAWCLQEHLFPYHRLFYEVKGLSLQHPERFPAFHQRGGWTPWLELLRGLPAFRDMAGNREAVMALMAATVTGALFSVLTTGDREPGTGAVELLARMIEERSA
jgi:AcrR family transcriptional regulator